VSIASTARGRLRKVFPGGWSFLLGELALYSLLVLVLTGVFLTLFFDPGLDHAPYEGSYAPLHGVLVSDAYSSVLDITFDIRGGLLMRQTHHWAALVFVAAIVLHLLRVFFTGAFRRPREINWVIGVTLFILAMIEGFTGYSLPDDLLSGTGLRIAHGILLSIPVVGTYLGFFAVRGEIPGLDIIPRLYVLHVLLLPGLLLALVLVHVLLVFRLQHTQRRGPGRTNRNVVGHPLVPKFTAHSAGLFFLVFATLVTLAAVAQVNPVHRYGPYRPDQVSTGAQPDWYVGFLEGSLRLVPAWETTLWGHTVMWNVLLPAVVLPGLLFTGLYLYPFFERWLIDDRREHHLCDRPRDRPTRTGLGVAGLTGYVVLLVAGGNDVIALVLDVSLNALTWTLRFALVLAPVAAFVVTKSWCLGLQTRDRERLAAGDATGAVRQTVEGRLMTDHRALTPEDRYTLLSRDMPCPLRLDDGAGAAPPSRVQRSRVALSRWFHRDRVELAPRPRADPGGGPAARDAR
jgi:ubiquinol-cytochrome c reductase cytochrome b subunit